MIEVEYGPPEPHRADIDPPTIYDWDRECEICRTVPVVAANGMCEGCTFGSYDAYEEDFLSGV